MFVSGKDNLFDFLTTTDIYVRPFCKDNPLLQWLTVSQLHGMVSEGFELVPSRANCLQVASYKDHESLEHLRCRQGPDTSLTAPLLRASDQSDSKVRNRDFKLYSLCLQIMTHLYLT